MRKSILPSVIEFVVGFSGATLDAEAGHSSEPCFTGASLMKAFISTALIASFVLLAGCFDSSEKNTTQKNADSAPGSVQMQQKDDQKK
jgi:hypothetical protein